MNAKKNCYPTFFLLIINALWMSSSYAAECELSGIGFANLNNDQVLVLQKSGASCSFKNEKKSAKDFKLGDLGFVILDGKKVSYLDLASEGALALYGKEVEMYGYIDSFKEADSAKVRWGYRFDFEMYEGGEYLKSIKRMTSTNPKISILAEPNIETAEASMRAWASMRKEIFKAGTLANYGQALIRVRGVVKAFSNGHMYILTESLDLIAK